MFLYFFTVGFYVVIFTFYLADIFIQSNLHFANLGLDDPCDISALCGIAGA